MVVFPISFFLILALSTPGQTVISYYSQKSKQKVMVNYSDYATKDSLQNDVLVNPL